MTPASQNVFLLSTMFLFAVSKADDLLLPRRLVPYHYNVEVQPHIYGQNADDFWFGGKVQIYFWCKHSTDVIILHAVNLSVSDVQLSLSSEERRVQVLLATLDPSAQHLRIRLNEYLVQEKYYKMQMKFSGRLKMDLLGLYVTTHPGPEGTHQFAAASQLSPIFARKMFPCFDEPDLKAKFNVTVIRKRHLVALSNMPLLHTESRSGDWVADHFQTTPPMSTYLLAVFVGNYTYKETWTNSAIRVRLWMPADFLHKTNTDVLEQHRRLLDEYENYLAVPYTLSKVDILLLELFHFGGMENWGLLQYQARHLVAVDGGQDKLPRAQAEIVMAHEVAHQWFGNLVTMEEWGEVWVKEGPSSYIYLKLDQGNRQGEDKTGAFLIDEKRYQGALELDSHVTTHPLTRTLHTVHDVMENFDHVAYGKGPALYYMMNGLLGDKAFQELMQDFLQTYQYSCVNRYDLWRLAQQRVEEGSSYWNVAEVMDTWALQPGYPVVHVTRSTDGTKLFLRQQRYLVGPDGKFMADPDRLTWKIPITYMTSSRPWWSRDMYVMEQRQELLSGLGLNNWVILNYKHIGFYRVNYDALTWDNIRKQLLEDHQAIPVYNRIQLIRDACDMERAGLLIPGFARSLLEYVDQEQSPIVLTVVDRCLHYHKRQNDSRQMSQMYSRDLGLIRGPFHISKKPSVIDNLKFPVAILRPNQVSLTTRSPVTSSVELTRLPTSHRPRCTDATTCIMHNGGTHPYLVQTGRSTMKLVRRRRVVRRRQRHWRQLTL